MKMQLVRFWANSPALGNGQSDLREYTKSNLVLGSGSDDVSLLLMLGAAMFAHGFGVSHRRYRGRVNIRWSDPLGGRFVAFSATLLFNVWRRWWRWHRGVFDAHLWAHPAVSRS